MTARRETDIPSVDQEAGRPLQSPLVGSLLATAAVVLVPGLASYVLFVQQRDPPAPELAVVSTLLLTVVAVVAGSMMWAGRGKSVVFSFGDLMLWNWIRRQRAEARLRRQTRLLGFSRDGSRVGEPAVKREKRVDALGQISLALDAKSSYTYKHTDRVERLARRIGRRMGLDQARIESLAIAALLHDVGNIRIPEELLRRPGLLTEEEKKLIESHTLLGALMSYDAVDREVADAILYHQEHWDGSGYPNGVAGEQIPVYARIIAVAEAFDAMTSTRPYRESLDPSDAVAELRAAAGRQFEPDVVEALVATMPKTLLVLQTLRVPAALRTRLWEVVLSFKRVGALAVSVVLTTAIMAFLLGTGPGP